MYFFRFSSSTIIERQDNMIVMGQNIVVVRLFKIKKTTLFIILYCARILVIKYTDCVVITVRPKIKKKKKKNTQWLHGLGRDHIVIILIQCGAKDRVKRKGKKQRLSWRNINNHPYYINPYPYPRPSPPWLS